MKIRVSQEKIYKLGRGAFTVALLGLAILVCWTLLALVDILFTDAPEAVVLGGAMFFGGVSVGLACAVASAWLDIKKGEKQ